MEPKLIDVAPFSVAGVSVRTRNVDEADPATGKLGPLWIGFQGDGMGDKITHRTEDQNIYGVYYDYESDQNGSYTVTAGVAVSAGSEGHDTVEVPGGKYLVFTEKGEMPQIIINAWMALWSYFAGSTEYSRKFTADFEAYSGPNEVAIHIAVE